MRIHENGCRCAAAANLFQNFAVSHLRESTAAIFLRRSHAEHADSAEAINHTAWYIRFPIDLPGIEMFVQKLLKLGKSFIEFGLLRRRNARIRHHPISNEMPLEKAFGKTQGLRTCKKQFLSLLNLFLSLRVELIHSICLGKNRRRIVAMRARMSNHTQVSLLI